MQTNCLINERKNSNINNFLEMMSSKMELENLRLDYKRPIHNIYDKTVLEFKFNKKLSGKIVDSSNNEPFLVYTFLMTALSICLYKYNNLSVITIGSPTLKTSSESYKDKNALIVMNNFDDNTLSFKEMLDNVRINLLGVYKNKSDYSVRNIIRELNLDRITYKCPLFNVSLSLDNIHNDMPEVGHDINITCHLDGKNIVGNIHFKKNIFNKNSIKQLLKYYFNILHTGARDPSISLSDISLISDENNNNIIFNFNKTDMDYPSDKCLHQLFEIQMEKCPNATAVVCGDQKISYLELNDKSNQLAHYLRRLSVNTNLPPIGLFINRSIEMIIGMLAILKSGAAYIPLDSNYPKGRVSSMLKTTKFKFILTNSSLVHKLPETSNKILCLDEDWDKISQESRENIIEQINVDHLAYVIFTSGSTGVPKGAGIYHKGWSNLLYWFSKEFDINDQDRNLIISSFSFDVTQRAIAMSLVNGGELHLLASDCYDHDLIIKTILLNKITLINCAPSAFYPLVEGNKPQKYKELLSLRLLFLGGETISANRLVNWVKSDQFHTKVVNVYGVAECSDVSSFYVLDKYDQYINSSVPAGKPIYNNRVYILDNDSQQVPVGIVGEICVAGEGVGIGYINDVELTKEKFIVISFSSNKREKLYKTGDLGRLLPDGTIEYIGRTDHQIKIRGLRIELGDLEASIRLHPLIKEVVVISKIFFKNDHRLVAYLVPNPVPANLTDEELIVQVREFSKEKLPAYMIPNHFMLLNELPINPNGKIDRDALPMPDMQNQQAFKIDNRSQLNRIEKILIQLFVDFLKIEDIGIDDNFFDLGGHSLLATQVITHANEHFGLQLKPIDFLSNPTVRGFSKRIALIGSH